MSRVPRSFVDGYADSLESLSEDMRKKLAESLKRINWDAPVADVRDALITVMQGYCGSSADVAASLAAEFYDGLRERMIGERYGAVLAPDYSDEAVDQFVRWAVQPLVDDGADGSQSVVDRLNERIGYEVKRSAGNTVFRNGERDPRKVRFARVPRGSKSYPHGCPFCQMLASRGFVYRNAKTAGEMNHFHADCQCMVVPGFGDNPTVEGYDPNEYMDRWKHPEKYADEGAGQQEQEQTSDATRSKSERKAIFDEYMATAEKGQEMYRQIMAETDEARKAALRSERDRLIEAANEIKARLTKGEYIIENVRHRGIASLPMEKWGKVPTTDEIVQVLGGGDRTSGSCSSLAFSYFGNKGGNVVRDFRGGASMDFFSRNGNIMDIARMDGVESLVETDRNAFKAAARVLQRSEEGKQYYLSVGRHAAVVERRGDEFFYLELQSQDDNGWHKITNSALKTRFGCTKSASTYGIKIDQEALLIDGDTLSDSSEFMELMEFINTEESAQNKGVGGHVR